MWEYLVSLPVLGLALMLQVAIFSRLNLLYGSADLLLIVVAAWSLQERVRSAWVWCVLAGLLVGYVSGLPWFVPLVGYLLVTGLAAFLRQRVWQAPLLAMFIVCFIGTLVMQTLAFVVLRLLGDPLAFDQSFSLIILPSVLLNLFIGMLVYPLLRNLAAQFHPEEVD
ncbi:MAG: rod shape-determining protein MreD [Anaerolineales bacterium]|nr:rod shape-determining protein MreD [Anaerolineales bacterium]